MTTRWMLAAVGAALMVVAGSLGAAEKKDPLAGITCPVSGKAVSSDVAADYKGGKLYFCCGGCSKTFAKDTAKYAAKANRQLVATGQAKQTGCPLTGKNLNPATAVSVAGVKVCFCCNGCKGKAVAAKGDAQLELVFGKKFDEAFEVKTE